MTPMMQQLQAAREQHPGMTILFQNGEFFELFGPDAEVGHKILGLTLTKREETPMAGFPLAKLDHHLRQMLHAGLRVAVVEQMEPPNTEGKKIIRRDVTRVVTLGTVTEEELLDPRKPNHLVALVKTRKGTLGLAWIDLTAGVFRATDVTDKQFDDEFGRLSVAECLIPDGLNEEIRPRLSSARSITSRPDWHFEAHSAHEQLRLQFGVSTFTGFGFDDQQPCLLAAGALVQYLRETVKASLNHIKQLQRHRAEAYLMLDEVTRRSLELTRTLRDNQRDGSLLSSLDRTVTSMGARALHDQLLAPLQDPVEIEARYDAVEELLNEHGLRQQLRDLLDGTSDLHRLTTKCSTARATPKDLAAMLRTLRLLPELKKKLTGRRASLLQQLEVQLDLVPDIHDLLVQAIQDDPPYSPKEGGVIREGYHAELDELRKLSRNGKEWMAQFQATEIQRTGIHSLKVGFTDVMGYYIEITNANETRVPADYLHERTLKNAKRYITPKLKEYEEKILTAQEKSQALEFELFLKVRDNTAARTDVLMQSADALAMLDVLAGLAELAASRNYVRPTLSTEPILDVVDGRHPVLDQILAQGTFTPNDTTLSVKDGMFWLVTGPNMAGKSSFLRQTALIVLLAHIGSFVPARRATIGLTDRIFTRVGASDELSRGQSTFMVEMTEAANILNNATPHSLVILDEIGRGTATYDGVSLAWAMTEYLHDAVQCRTLFATHYHELAQLENRLPRLRNYTVAVKELADEVIFLHKVLPGSAGKSYGLHVARLAGVPEAVIRRADVVLRSLEQPDAKVQSSSPMVQPPEIKPRKKVKPIIEIRPTLFGGLNEPEA